LVKEAGLAALVVIALAIALVGLRTLDVPGRLDIETRFGAVAMAAVVTFFGRLATILLRQRRATPVLFGAGAFSAYLLVLTVASLTLEGEGDTAALAGTLLPFGSMVVNVVLLVVSEGVVFMAGHFCSGSSIPASNVYSEEGILQISPASTNPKLTEEGGPNVFRVCGRDDQQGLVAGAFLKEKFGNKRVAFLHDKTAYGKGLADATKAQFNKLGGKEVMYEAYTAQEKDYSAIVSKMKAARIDAFYVGGYHTEAGLMIRQAHEQGYKPQLISGDALVTDEFWKITGKAGEGTLMTFSPDPRKNPDAAPVVAKFRAQNYEPEGYTLYTYGAIQAWVAAVKAAGSTDTPKVIAALRGGKFSTVLGKIGFDKMGDVTAPGYVWYEWKGGKYDYTSDK
jgi:branched-chain amino acid transport system substrate-binding protein